MIAATAIASMGVFLGALRLSGLLRIGAEILVIAKGALASMRDPSLDDEAREAHARRAAVRLFGGFVSIFLRSVLTLLAAFLPIWAASLTGAVEIAEVLAYLARWDVIVVATVVIVVGYLGWRRLWPSR